MVKHRNSISNGHFRKHWQKFVKTDFDKSSNKKRRRMERISKLTNTRRYNFSPKNLLKPIVHNPTKMYNLKIRLGRGFSLSELNKSDIPRKLACSVGISIDKRRRGDELKESSNTIRLNNYLKKLNLVPLKKNSAENLIFEKISNYNFSEKQIKNKVFEKSKKLLKRIEFDNIPIIDGFHTLRSIK
mmetsp:Transcript_81783/g.132625  ORF Transcript_81783/g.132625 Transcript_81783/m.132625 type:complete len:186 (+) Transcript_81783:952-1509(+)